VQSRGISAHDIRTFGRARGGGQNGGTAQQPAHPQPHPIPNAPNDADEEPEAHEAVQEVEETGVGSTSSQTVAVEITTPPIRRTRASRKKRRRGSDDDLSGADDDEEVDPLKYGRAAFSHKKRASVMQPGKIDFCHICSQRFTVTAYTKTSPDGEGLLCHKCGAVEQAKVANAARPKRNRTKVGKGRSKMLQEGKDDWVGTLQDACIKATPWQDMKLTIGYCEAYS